MSLMRYFNRIIRSCETYNFKGRTVFKKNGDVYTVLLPLKKLVCGELTALDKPCPIDKVDIIGVNLKEFYSLPKEVRVKYSRLWDGFAQCINIVKLGISEDSYDMKIYMALSKDNKLYPYGIEFSSPSLNYDVIKSKDFINSDTFIPRYDEIVKEVKNLDLSFGVINSKPIKIDYKPYYSKMYIEYEDGYSAELDGTNFCMLRDKDGLLQLCNPEKYAVYESVAKIVLRNNDFPITKFYNLILN